MEVGALPLSPSSTGGVCVLGGGGRQHSPGWGWETGRPWQVLGDQGVAHCDEGLTAGQKLGAGGLCSWRGHGRLPEPWELVFRR